MMSSFMLKSWHDNEYRKMGVKYMVITKDPKGTFALKSNGNHTKYLDFFEEDSRLYVDYNPNGYPICVLVKTFTNGKRYGWIFY